jgi:hypothetical protein
MREPEDSRSPGPAVCRAVPAAPGWAWAKTECDAETELPEPDNALWTKRPSCVSL